MKCYADGLQCTLLAVCILLQSKDAFCKRNSRVYRVAPPAEVMGGIVLPPVIQPSNTTDASETPLQVLANNETNVTAEVTINDEEPTDDDDEEEDEGGEGDDDNNDYSAVTPLSDMIDKIAKVSLSLRKLKSESFKVAIPPNTISIEKGGDNETFIKRFVYVPRSDRLSLACSTGMSSLSPFTDFHWFIGNQTITQALRPDHMQIGPLNELIIEDVDSSDSAQYSCEANRTGVLYVNVIDVHVYFPADIAAVFPFWFMTSSCNADMELGLKDQFQTIFCATSVDCIYRFSTVCRTQPWYKQAKSNHQPATVQVLVVKFVNANYKPPNCSAECVFKAKLTDIFSEMDVLADAFIKVSSTVTTAHNCTSGDCPTELFLLPEMTLTGTKVVYICDAGYMLYRRSACVPCWAGEYTPSRGSNEDCTLCPALTYQPNPASVDCIACPNVTTNGTVIGATSFDACPIPLKGTGKRMMLYYIIAALVLLIFLILVLILLYHFRRSLLGICFSPRTVAGLEDKPDSPEEKRPLKSTKSFKKSSAASMGKKQSRASTRGAAKTTKDSQTIVPVQAVIVKSAPPQKRDSQTIVPVQAVIVKSAPPQKRAPTPTQVTADPAKPTPHAIPSAFTAHGPPEPGMPVKAASLAAKPSKAAPDAAKPSTVASVTAKPSKVAPVAAKASEPDAPDPVQVGPVAAKASKSAAFDAAKTRKSALDASKASSAAASDSSKAAPVAAKASTSAAPDFAKAAPDAAIPSEADTFPTFSATGGFPKATPTAPTTSVQTATTMPIATVSQSAPSASQPSKAASAAATKTSAMTTPSMTTLKAAPDAAIPSEADTFPTFSATGGFPKATPTAPTTSVQTATTMPIATVSQSAPGTAQPSKAASAAATKASEMTTPSMTTLKAAPDAAILSEADTFPTFSATGGFPKATPTAPTTSAQTATTMPIAKASQSAPGASQSSKAASAAATKASAMTTPSAPETVAQPLASAPFRPIGTPAAPETIKESLTPMPSRTLAATSESTPLAGALSLSYPPEDPTNKSRLAGISQSGADVPAVFDPLSFGSKQWHSEPDPSPLPPLPSTTSPSSISRPGSTAQPDARAVPTTSRFEPYVPVEISATLEMKSSAMERMQEARPDSGNYVPRMSKTSPSLASASTISTHRAKSTVLASTAAAPAATPVSRNAATTFGQTPSPDDKSSPDDPKQLASKATSKADQKSPTVDSEKKPAPKSILKNAPPSRVTSKSSVSELDRNGRPAISATMTAEDVPDAPDSKPSPSATKQVTLQLTPKRSPPSQKPPGTLPPESAQADPRLAPTTLFAAASSTDPSPDGKSSPEASKDRSSKSDRSGAPIPSKTSRSLTLQSARQAQSDLDAVPKTSAMAALAGTETSDQKQKAPTSRRSSDSLSRRPSKPGLPESNKAAQDVVSTAHSSTAHGPSRDPAHESADTPKPSETTVPPSLLGSWSHISVAQDATPAEVILKTFEKVAPDLKLRAIRVKVGDEVDYIEIPEELDIRNTRSEQSERKFEQVQERANVNLKFQYSGPLSGTVSEDALHGSISTVGSPTHSVPSLNNPPPSLASVIGSTHPANAEVGSPLTGPSQDAGANIQQPSTDARSASSKVRVANKLKAYQALTRSGYNRRSDRSVADASTTHSARNSATGVNSSPEGAAKGSATSIKSTPIERASQESIATKSISKDNSTPGVNNSNVNWRRKH